LGIGASGRSRASWKSAPSPTVASSQPATCRPIREPRIGGRCGRGRKSPRLAPRLLAFFEADAVGCQIIAATNDIIKKLSLAGYDLDRYSLDTVKMFYNDALQAGFVV
jgi:hypothetical protein